MGSATSARRHTLTWPTLGAQGVESPRCPPSLAPSNLLIQLAAGWYFASVLSVAARTPVVFWLLGGIVTVTLLLQWLLPWLLGISSPVDKEQESGR